MEPLLDLVLAVRVDCPRHRRSLDDTVRFRVARGQFIHERRAWGGLLAAYVFRFRPIRVARWTPCPWRVSVGGWGLADFPSKKAEEERVANLSLYKEKEGLDAFFFFWENGVGKKFEKVSFAY